MPLNRADDLRRKKESSKEARDIGPPPECADYALRLRIQDDLEAFLRECFPDLFPWPFSKDQIRSIHRQQQIICDGGLHLDAEPRGSGKTQRALRAALWAILTGRRHYVCVIAATANLSTKIMRALRSIVRMNELLYWIFPEELHGFPQMENHNRAAAGQLCMGQETGINLAPEQLVFPRVPGSSASNSVIAAFGITGSVRGQFHQRLDGSVIRPDLVLLDDPQTKASADSPAQTQERYEIIHSDILGLSGPATSIACSALCTFIENDDLSERLFNEPKWHGQRSKTFVTFPKNLGAWDRYFEEYIALEKAGELSKINAYYIANRVELDDGAEVAWEHRIRVGDESAIQTAMHIRHDVGVAAFAAEYQNEPLHDQISAQAPTFAGLENKLTRLPRGIVPVWATKLTCTVDVQERLLFYAVCAWSDEFSGAVIDYGAWPGQSRNYFTYSEAAPTLQSASGISQPEGSIRWGLDGLSAHLCGRNWEREGGGEARIDSMIVDANYQSDTVYEFCRRCPYPVLPSHGRGIKAGDKPIDQYTEKRGDTKGFHWFLTFGDNRRAIKHVLGDVNFWKCFLAARSAAKPGEKGSLSLFGDRPEQHRLFVDHLVAEFPTQTFGRGREVWEWKKRPGQDNHWLDCLVLGGIAASMLNVSLEDLPKPKSRSDRRTFSLPGKR